MDDAAGFFANVFGGERFHDYVRIISLIPVLLRLNRFLLTDW